MSAPVRVLMSEGSSLSARESLTALGVAGFHVEVVDPDPLCLARFSRWCRRRHGAPRFGADPEGYLDRIAALLASGAFDVLYPAHEQAFLFALHRERLEQRTRLALPDFPVFERMQSKVGFAGVLDELGLAGARTEIAHDESSLRERATRFPLYLKAAFGTATQGTFRVDSAADLADAVAALRPVLGEGVLVQQALPGWLGRTQAVFAHGRLVAFHACRQVEEGVGGGDWVKESIASPGVQADVERLGRRLGWHGGLSLDFLVDAEGRPRYIDSNPRLAEPGNALAAGVNLPEALVRVSLGREPGACIVGRPGVRSYMGIQGLLRAAKETGSRRGVARALADLVEHRGGFAGGSEELTPVSSDLRSLVPLLAVAAVLVARPRSWRSLSRTTVDAYAATPAVVAAVRRGRTGFRPPWPG